MNGTVAEFDDAAGIGVVRDDESGVEHFFHCTQIADGSRTIAVGTNVSYEIGPGHRGRWEARHLRPR